MISKEQIHKFKAKREILMHRLSTAEEEEDKPYYERRLRALALEERDAWKDDLIQPDSNKFKHLYPEQWKKGEKEKEDKHYKKKRFKEERDKFIKDNTLEGKGRIMRALDLEEKIRNG